MKNSVYLGNALTNGLYCQCGRRTAIVDQSINGDGRSSESGFTESFLLLFLN